jgi:hypothetical protein
MRSRRPTPRRPRARSPAPPGSSLPSLSACRLRRSRWMLPPPRQPRTFPSRRRAARSVPTASTMTGTAESTLRTPGAPARGTTRSRPTRCAGRPHRRRPRRRCLRPRPLPTRFLRRSWSHSPCHHRLTRIRCLLPPDHAAKLGIPASRVANGPVELPRRRAMRMMTNHPRYTGRQTGTGYPKGLLLNSSVEFTRASMSAGARKSGAGR